MTSKIKDGLPKTREGLPREAFVIVGDPDAPETWKLPHHTRAIWRALRGRLDIEATVDWDRMGPAVAALSPGGYRGQRVDATAEQIRQAAPTKVGAAHYRRADRRVPDILAALT